MDTDQLRDIEQIKQLKARYFRCMDTKQWEDFAEVFTRDATLRWGEGEGDVFQGRTEIVERLRHILREAITVHHGYMPEIEITAPGQAHGIWAMSDRIEHPKYRLVGRGHYTETYRIEDDAWRIAATHLTRLTAERSVREAP